MALELLCVSVGKVIHLHLEDFDAVEPLLSGEIDALLNRLPCLVATKAPVAVGGHADATVALWFFLAWIILCHCLGGRCDGSSAESEGRGLEEVASWVIFLAGDWIAHWE